MAPRAVKRSIWHQDAGQSLALALGLLAALMLGALMLAAFGQALGAKGRHQRGADLAAIAAAQEMRRLYPRLFEPAYLDSGAPNPRHFSPAAGQHSRCSSGAGAEGTPAQTLLFTGERNSRAIASRPDTRQPARPYRYRRQLTANRVRWSVRGCSQ
jgi:Putative Flp pilus-assembly TadE/G-like